MACWILFSRELFICPIMALLPLVRYIREQTEAKATIVDQEDGEGGVETTEAPREGRNE